MKLKIKKSSIFLVFAILVLPEHAKSAKKANDTSDNNKLATPSSIIIKNSQKANYNALTEDGKTYQWNESWKLPEPGRGRVSFQLKRNLITNTNYPISLEQKPIGARFILSNNLPTTQKPSLNPFIADIRRNDKVSSLLETGAGDTAQYKHEKGAPSYVDPLLYRITIDQPNNVFIVEETSDNTMPVIDDESSYRKNLLFSYNPKNISTYPSDTPRTNDKQPFLATPLYSYFSFNRMSYSPDYYSSYEYSNINVTALPLAAPEVLRCIDPLKFTCHKNNSSTTPAEQAWFDEWKTKIPGNFVIDLMTDYENNFTIGFSPTKLEATNNIPFCLSLGTDDGTGVRIAKDMPQAPKEYKIGTLLKSRIPFPNNANYKKIPGFEVEVVSLRIQLDQTQASPVLRVWCKAADNPANQYALLLDSTSPTFPAEDKEQLKEALGTEPLKYFSFTRGVKNGKPTNKDATDRVRIKNYGGYPEVGNIKVSISLR
ncbi:hypothetical protein FJ365_02435 [Candidatus Dependentiae bacterium]|nr:hypothetical protein [Candidatus Dependentiae bacterium]